MLERPAARTCKRREARPGTSHRVGATARSGRIQQALVLLLRGEVEQPSAEAKAPHGRVVTR